MSLRDSNMIIDNIKAFLCVVSFSTSLAGLKEANARLLKQNKQLQAQVSLSDTKRRETERQLNSRSLSTQNKDSELIQLRGEISNLRENLAKVEAEKQRLERCYAQIEKEKCSLQRSLNNNTQSDYRERKTETLMTTTTTRQDKILNETSILSQGLAALEQENIKLQEKVTNLQTLMNEAERVESVQKLGTSERRVNSSSSFSSNFSASSNGRENERLKLAQKQAEQLLEVREKAHKKHVADLRKEVNIAFRVHLSLPLFSLRSKTLFLARLFTFLFIQLHVSPSKFLSLFSILFSLKFRFSRLQISSLRERLATASPSFSSTPSKFKEPPPPRPNSASGRSGLSSNGPTATSTPIAQNGLGSVKRRLDL